MIPEKWLNEIEEYKQKPYEEAQKYYNSLMELQLNLGKAANDISYWSDWCLLNNNKNNGWNNETYYSNNIGVSTTRPHMQYVKQYFTNLFLQSFKPFNELSSSDFVSNFLNNIELNANWLNGYINDYEYKLSRTIIKSKKNDIQNAIDILNEDIIICNDLIKQYKEYWQGWDTYNTMWNSDLNEFNNKWNDTLNYLKNPLTNEQTNETKTEDPKTNNENNSLTTENNTTPNAFSSSADNIYQSVVADTSTDVSINKTHTRIYEYRASTIQLDEMSIPVIDDDGSNATIDPSTNQHIDASTSNLSGNIPYKTDGNKSPLKSMALGFTYPLLRINDHYFTNNDIVYFELSSVRFIPTIEVKLSCTYNDLLKSNMIKDGDKCSVFINPGHGTIKSYRGDFQITHVKVSDMNQFIVNSRVSIRFTAELYIPTIYDSTQTFAFSGSSRDALIDAAEKLGLGFFFSDPENTNDAQMWYSLSDGEQKTNQLGMSPAIEYIQNTARHAYKNFESFYDCWIDPRYAITFINIAQMLGGVGLDEPIDLALFNTTSAYGKETDAENKEDTPEKKAKKPRPQVKLLTNIGEDESSFTAFLVTSYAERNDGTISNRLGFSNTNYISIKNPGFTKVEDNSIEMNLTIPVNADKLKHGFFIMAGPGQNLTYTEGKNGSYIEQHTAKQGGTIAETQSDGDGEEIVENGNNMLASGNTNKFYETAEGHNILCNAWLKKKTVVVTLNGCNMQMMRGEKIPMLLRDNFNPATTLALGKDDNKMTYQKILATGTGWFIIKSIKWIYDIDNPQRGTSWRTELVLTRREWPIPDYVKDSAPKEMEEAQIVINNDIETGSVKQAIEDQMTSDINNTTTTSTSNSNTTNVKNILSGLVGMTNGIGSSGTNTIDDTQNAAPNEMTTNGVNQYLVDIYNEIKDSCAAGGAKILLVSARRWPVDENNNVVDTPVVQDGNTWKFKNAKGDIVWYSSKTSPHATGDAIDIINDEGTKFEDIIQYIIAEDKILYDMITNGVYVGKEVSSDGGNSIIHYHIGKIDKSNPNAYKIQAAWWNVVAKIKETIKYNGHSINVKEFNSYSH